MKKTFMLCLFFIVSMSIHALAESELRSEDPSIQVALETLKNAYSAEIVIGSPIEVNGLKIIPLATVGVGVGPYDVQSDKTRLAGAGGLLMPIGVIVVSGQKVKIVQVSKGLVEQIVSALAPIALQLMNQLQDTTADAKIQEAVEKQGVPEKQGSFLSTYWSFMAIFWLIWFVIAVVVQKFLPDKVTALAATFRYRAIQISLFGLLGFGMMFLLAILFTISIIGIPFTFALLILIGILTLFGTIGFALFMGQESATAFKYHYSDMRLLLIGGGLLGLLGMIPLFGLIVWALIAIFGFGAVLQMQRESLGRKSL